SSAAGGGLLRAWITVVPRSLLLVRTRLLLPRPTGLLPILGRLHGPTASACTATAAPPAPASGRVRALLARLPWACLALPRARPARKGRKSVLLAPALARPACPVGPAAQRQCNRAKGSVRAALALHRPLLPLLPILAVEATSIPARISALKRRPTAASSVSVKRRRQAAAPMRTSSR